MGNRRRCKIFDKVYEFCYIISRLFNKKLKAWFNKKQETCITLQNFHFNNDKIDLDCVYILNLLHHVILSLLI